MVIPYGSQDITESDISSVADVLRSKYITQGQMVVNFEKDLCDFTNAKHSSVVNSCTAALHIACLSLGVGKDDLVWTSPISFVASANCAVYCGATVDFVDIDIDTGLMSTSALSKKLKIANNNNKLPSVVIPVHFSGQSCDMKKIYSLSKEYGFKIIEDAAHALGGEYDGDPIGCCKYSDITVFSFHPVKMITTGEGGALMCNNKKLKNSIDLFRSHGITRNKNNFISKNIKPEWYYEQIDLGFNYRMTDFQAALGSSQIKRLSTYVDKRNKIASIYDTSFSEFKDINPLITSPECRSSYHLYVVRISGKYLGYRDHLYRELKNQKIQTNVHYIPIYRQPFYDTGIRLNNTEKYYSQAISLPIFPSLKYDEQQRVIKLLIDIIHSV
jgi:UDP-4-amino-4,6-dideoxy-N-acetyl-beta-L-altrosamine transaminase